QLVPPGNIFAIIGYEAERVREALAPTGINFVLQREQRGTGHALMEARDALQNFETVLVLSGDVPLIRTETIAQLRDFHAAQAAAMTILTAEPDDPTGYGRVIRMLKKRKKTDEVARIVEQKALKRREVEEREVTSGIYAFATTPLYQHIAKLTTDNAHGEYYLTDMAALLDKAGEKVVALRAPDSSEVLGVNTRLELPELDSKLRDKKARELMEAGITIFRPQTCDIDAHVQVGTDTVIEPFVQLIGRTRIGSDCRIRSYSVITNSDIGEEAHVGNFVETKKTRLGNGSKANHLTYLGDSEIGENVNVGAGTITCNYDGVNKHQTLIDDGAFIGSDATLVAPVRIGRGAYIGAASCITEDVPDD